jgi:protein-L-isoaspartate(D-aspartate) O-methyltransferase
MRPHVSHGILVKIAGSGLAAVGVILVLAALVAPAIFRSWREVPSTTTSAQIQQRNAESRSADEPDSAERNRRSHDGPGDAIRRECMVESQLRSRDITDERTLKAMARVPRHAFVPERHRDRAYDDTPLPIPHGQTISQPYIVALMTQLAQLGPDSRVLDVGTGSGYQAAVLAEIVDHVYSIEIVRDLADEGSKRLTSLGYDNVDVRCGDGYRGWPEKAPFDAIIVAAAPDHVPQSLIDQLAVGGRLIVPVGRLYQELLVIEKGSDRSTRRRSVAPVAFVPMTGEAQKRGGNSR